MSKKPPRPDEHPRRTRLERFILFILGAGFGSIIGSRIVVKVQTPFDGAGEVSGAWVTGRPSSATPGLLLYVMVDSITATSKATGAHVGRIVQPPGADAPELTARFADPDGNVLGLYQQPGQST